MKTIEKDAAATLEFELSWNSHMGEHKEVYFAEHVNFWRDIIPANIYDELMGCRIGDQITVSLQHEEILPEKDKGGAVRLKRNQFRRRMVNGEPIEPRLGRFYPQGLLEGVAGVYPSSIEPFRCVHLSNSYFSADFNHPLAGKEIHLAATVHDIRKKDVERGGRLMDWMETVVNGPGMQIRCNGIPTDFFHGKPFARENEDKDAAFYETPRLVNHTDDRAREQITRIYGALLKPGMRVLDLMTSWRSHLPESLHLKGLVGLGMNSQEMAENPQLTDYVVHDLNSETRLPFDDDHFDAVICTVSVEYMIHPFQVFADVARVLKSGGLFVHTFSNRWFPPKAIKIWSELTEFERTGLISEYFLSSGAYENLNTYSVRGWPRPETDRYFPQILTADPVYAVWAHRHTRSN